MSRSRIQARLGRVVDLGRARCSARSHQFSKLGRDGTGKGNIEPAAGAIVWGVVYEIDALQLDRLVEFEFGYRVIGLELDLEILGPAITFEALRPTPNLTPSRDYLEHYIAGIREHAIPEDYLTATLGEWLNPSASPNSA